MKRAVEAAKLGESDRLFAIRHLDEEARKLEKAAKGPSFDAFVAKERAEAPRNGGRTVFGEALNPDAPSGTLGRR